MMADVGGPGLRRGDDYGKARCIFVANPYASPRRRPGPWACSAKVARSGVRCAAAGGVVLQIAWPDAGTAGATQVGISPAPDCAKARSLWSVGFDPVGEHCAVQRIDPAMLDHQA
ncbi:hypothetical protein GCM10011329_11000 [Stakelama pacifica]|nr:hypothetical protein GCM10011329_11000 [Stakelama pacifica]